jgi:hypothetical protein
MNMMNGSLDGWFGVTTSAAGVAHRKGPARRHERQLMGRNGEQEIATFHQPIVDGYGNDANPL